MMQPHDGERCPHQKYHHWRCISGRVATTRYCEIGYHLHQLHDRYPDAQEQSCTNPTIQLFRGFVEREALQVGLIFLWITCFRRAVDDEILEWSPELVCLQDRTRAA